ncbi:hypothetical protein NE848_14135 [Gramella jeungdoensis]|uniref:Uncharacterized protein n=1 Tax=Gramella jeungdoensis TaxID=708091 RepID=A0ABT0Z468_9FLAO|nr:hypothetical protein [Gramella jeungdoensis]MCM8570530.1 hypothetical protein [Gramella jeungdoensis]
MKIINRYLAFVAIVAMLFTSCSKDETTSPPVDDPSVQSVDLTFGAVLNDLSNRAMAQNKTHFNQVPDCSGTEPAYVELEISYDGQAPETMGVITIDVLSDSEGYFTAYSELLKVPVPDGESVQVTLNSFIVYDSEDTKIWIAPIENTEGEFAGYVDNPLPLEFDVEDGTKPYIDVEVLCFDRRVVNEYGYVFFDILPEKIYPFCLFVNYCDEFGRHFVANYSVDLYFGTDDTGIQLYDNWSLDDVEDAGYGVYESGAYYSDPLCLVVPGPPANLPANEPYLYLVIHPRDWEGNYGDIDNTPTTSILISWDVVNGLLNPDGTTNEYHHVLIGECEGAIGSGDGGGNGGNGGTECDPLDPEANCDNDDLLNKCDPDNVHYDTFDCDGDEVPNGQDLCLDTPPNTTVDGDGCEVVDENPIPETCEFNLAGENCEFFHFDQSEFDPDAPLYEVLYNGANIGSLTIETISGEVNVNYTLDFPYTVDDIYIVLDDGTTDYCGSNLSNDINSEYTITFGEEVYGDQSNVQVYMNLCEN